MLETNEIFYNGEKWQYLVYYRKQKHMYLRWKNQKLVVSAPYFVNMATIEKFVLENLNSISQKIQDAKTKVSNKLVFGKESYVYFLDQKLKLIFKYNAQTKIYLNNDSLLVYSKYSFDIKGHQEKLEAQINMFLKKLAQPIFQERLLHWEQKMNLKSNDFNLRLMRSKWGVCFYNSQKITFNYKLVHFSYDIIDYVIIHELTHLLYPNHTKEFWDAVSQYCLDYKQKRNILKHSNVEGVYEKD